ncbi:MAG: acylphosphatase [Planctomycetota bacterium]|nr:acylphosphatase [Planctomycetota bacterium]
MPTSRYSITFSGRVQGVFFRATTLEISRRFAIKGWVRNERDGSVRCIAEGDRKELDAFVEAITHAKQSNIENVQIDTSDSTGEFEGFNIRY